MQVARDRRRRPDESSDLIEVVDADKCLRTATLREVGISRSA